MTAQIAQAIVVAFVFLPLTGATGSAGASEAWEAAAQRAAQAFDAGRCADGWRVLWPAALAGKKKAFQGLSGMVVFRGLVPPGVDLNPAALKREALNLSLLGLDRRDPQSIALASNMLDLNGHTENELKECLFHGEPQICINRTAKKDVVMSANDYVSRINSALKSEHDANCR